MSRYSDDESTTYDEVHRHVQHRTTEITVKKKQPSSADGGFFQKPPKLDNQFLEDTVFQRIIDREPPNPATSPRRPR